MGVIKGLANIRERFEESGEGSGVKWFKMPNGGTWRIRFMDDAIQIEEHQAGNDYRRRAQCTKTDEGRCFACEQAIAKPKTGWARKERVYFNVIVDDGIDDPYVAVWSVGTRRSPVWDQIYETLVEEGSISDREWRIKRNGEGTDTRYMLRDLGKDDKEFDFSNFNGYDLEGVIKVVPYDEQQAHYIEAPGGGASDEDTTDEW